MTEYKFKTSELEAQIETLSQKGITEFSVHDASLAKDKRRVLKIINLIAQYAPDVFFYIHTDSYYNGANILRFKIRYRLGQNAAELFAKGELKPNFFAKCDHHGEHHHE